MTRITLTALLALLAALIYGIGWAQPATPEEQRELVVATKETPPFVMKDAEGNWQGISIELWRHIADATQLRYRVVEVKTVQELIDGVAARKFDAAIAALTITPARERIVTFTQPFFLSGLGIAVPAASAPSWTPVIRSLMSYGFLNAVIGLIALAFTAGALLWLFEHRRNDNFAGTLARGLSFSVWWSTAAMTQRGASAFHPVTLPGRVIAIFWMVISIIAIAVFTASLTSALTTRQLLGTVHSAGDLPLVRVGTVAQTASETALARMRINYRGFASVQDGLKALRKGEIDALVHDRPLLAWTIKTSYAGSAELLDTTFDPQTYGIAVTEGSPLKKRLDVALLEAVQSDWWQTTLFRYLGAR